MLAAHGESRILHKASVIFFMILMQSHGYSQLRPISTLLHIQEFSLSSVPRNPHFIFSSNTQAPDILYFDAQHLRLVILANHLDGTFSEPHVVDTLTTVTSLSTGNLNNDGIDDIVVVQRDKNRIIVFLSNRKDSAYIRQIFPVNFYPEQVVIGDLTGDHIADISVFGKLSSGVTVFRGKGKNKFTEGRTIFSDIPVSSLTIIRLNGDEIPDAVVRNWLSNEDVLYLGLGNLQFSEQSALSYGVDSTVTLFDDVNNDGITDAVVTSTQYQSLLVYLNDGLANFVREQSIPLFTKASEFHRASFSNSSVPDIILTGADESQFSVLLNSTFGTFSEEIVFGIPYRHFIIGSVDINGDGNSDVVCFNSDTSLYTVYWNQRTSNIDLDTARIAVGREPNNLFVTDINSDGFDDLLVSNGGSNTISILFGSLTSLSSQLSIETPDKPSSVHLYSKSDSALTIITSHSEDPKIGITTISRSPNTPESLLGAMESYTISLTGKPSHVIADISLQNVPMSLYVFLRGETNSIVFYQQLFSTQFIVKSLTPLIPSRITFATISDLNSDGFTDLVYLYNDKRTNKDIIGATLNDSKGEFSGATYALTLPDTGNRRSYILAEDLNSDQQKDYIYYHAPKKSLNVIIGKKNGEFSSLVPIADNVAISHQDKIQLYDYDGDGLIDILYLDSISQWVNLLRGKGNGMFFKVQQLFQAPSETVFRCGDFNGDGVSDIVFLHPHSSSLECRYGKKN